MCTCTLKCILGMYGPIKVLKHHTVFTCSLQGDAMASSIFTQVDSISYSSLNHQENLNPIIIIV